MTTQQPTEAQLLRRTYKQLRDSLPDTWSLDASGPPTMRSVGREQPDSIMTVKGPEGRAAVVLVEAKESLDPQRVRPVLEQLRAYADKISPQATLLVVASYLSPRTRELLTVNGASYADATGNLRIRLDNPAMYIERTGATKNPWDEPRPLHSLKGPTAGRVVRALCDYRPPFGVRELADWSQTPLSSVSRVLTLLTRESLLTRAERGKYEGRVLAVDWPRLIYRWSEDYGLTTSNTTVTVLEPRGLKALTEKLATVSWPYAITGSLAAAQFAPIAPSRLATVYVEDTEQAAESLKLRQAESGANVLLVRPFDPVVFERTTRQDGLIYAAFTQVAADLLTSPGRSPQEAEALINWMKENEDVWRQGAR